MPRDNWHRARLTMVTLPVGKRLCLCLFVWSLVRFLLYKPLLHASNYFACSDHNIEMIMCAWELSDQIETNLPHAQATCCRWHLYKRLDERWCRFQGWLASKTPWLVMNFVMVKWWFPQLRSLFCFVGGSTQRIFKKRHSANTKNWWDQSVSYELCK